MNRLRQFRQAKGWSLLELSRRAGLNHLTVLFIEKECTRKPRLSTISKLAFALGVDPAELVGEEK